MLIPDTTDGDYSTRALIEPTVVRRPFLNWPTKDSTTKIFERAYEIDRDSYVPFTALATAPADGSGADAADAAAYLVEEGEGTLDLDGTRRWRCLFAYIPGTQTRLTDRALNKPVFPTADYAGAWVDSTTAGVTANVYSAVIACAAATRISGGTFILTIDGVDTAPLAWNASAATIKAAVDPLLSGGATCTITGTIDTTDRIQITPNIGVHTLAIKPAGLTPTAISSATGGGSSTIFTIVRAAITITKAAHGLLVGAALRLQTTTTGGGDAAAVATVIDPDNFTVPQTLSGVNYLLPYYQPTPYYRALLRQYTPGLARVPCQKTLKFWLPTVTGGIATPADIPTPAVAINDTQLLTLVAGNATGYQPYDAEDLTGWPTADSPIYMRTSYEIDLGKL